MDPQLPTTETPDPGPNRDLDGSLILNGVSLLLTTVILLALRRFLHWAFPALVLHSYLPVALAGYIISLLLAYLALDLALRARRDPDYPITSRVTLGWAVANLGLGAYSLYTALAAIGAGGL